MRKNTRLFVGSALTLGGVALFLLVVVPLHFAQVDYDARSQLMSELALGAYGWAMIIAFGGLCLSAMGVAIAVWGGEGSVFLCWIFIFAAILFLLAGIFPLGRHDYLHIAAIAGAFVVSVLGIYLFPSRAGDVAGLVPKSLSVLLASGVVLSVLLGHSAVDMGIAQRLAAASLFLWFSAFGWGGLRRGARGDSRSL